MFSQSEFRFELCQFRVLEIESGQEWIHEAFDHIHLQAHQLLDSREGNSDILDIDSSDCCREFSHIWC